MCYRCGVRICSAQIDGDYQFRQRCGDATHLAVAACSSPGQLLEIGRSGTTSAANGSSLNSSASFPARAPKDRSSTRAGAVTASCVKRLDMPAPRVRLYAGSGVICAEAAARRGRCGVVGGPGSGQSRSLHCCPGSCGTSGQQRPSMLTQICKSCSFVHDNFCKQPKNLRLRVGSGAVGAAASSTSIISRPGQLRFASSELSGESYTCLPLLVSPCGMMHQTKTSDKVLSRQESSHVLTLTRGTAKQPARHKSGVHKPFGRHTWQVGARQRLNEAHDANA